MLRLPYVRVVYLIFQIRNFTPSTGHLLAGMNHCNRVYSNSLRQWHIRQTYLKVLDRLDMQATEHVSDKDGLDPRLFLNVRMTDVSVLTSSHDSKEARMSHVWSLWTAEFRRQKESQWKNECPRNRLTGLLQP